MFSKQATDKLAAIFDVVFAMKEPVHRADSLGAKPIVSAFDPKQLDSASKTLTIIGQGFQTGCTVILNGKDRKPSSVSAERIVIPLLSEDVAAPGNLKVVVKNPDGGTGDSIIKIA
jgi:hypothetical protein